MKTKFKSLIIDDDPLSVQHLTNFLEQTSLFESPFICSTAVSAIVILNAQPLDLLFLDIRLEDMSGMELLKLLPQRPPVIVVSAYPEYALESYDLDVQDFIAKPLTYARLLRSLRRTVLKSSPVPQYVKETEEILALPANPGSSVVEIPAPKSIFLKTGRKVERFVLNEILYVEAYTIYTKLINNNGIVVTNEKLSILENQLGPNSFMRVYKSYLINLDKVTQFNPNTIWIDSYKIPIGKTYKEKVQERLKALQVQRIDQPIE